MAGDLGAGAIATPGADDSGRVPESYFPPVDAALERIRAAENARPSTSRAASSNLLAAGKPMSSSAAPTPPTAGSAQLRKLKGEQRAARAEERRFGIKGKMGVEDGPAWWLDVMCPTVADMKELRKVGEA